MTLLLTHKTLWSKIFQCCTSVMSAKVLTEYLPVLNVHVIVKSILNWWSIAQAAPIESFHGLSKNVST